MLLLKELFGEEILAVNNPIKLAIFASGRGSNAKNIFEYIKEEKTKDSSFRLEAELLICDKENAPAIEMAKGFGVKTEVIPYVGNKCEHENKIHQILDQINPDYLCLCGYMRILSKGFVRKYTDENSGHSNIINIHPSLLPLFPGKDGYGDAFKAGVEESGITLHFVDEGVDTGPIIMQKSFEKKESDDLASFKARGLELEHKLYRELLYNLNKNGVIEI